MAKNLQNLIDFIKDFDQETNKGKIFHIKHNNLENTKNNIYR